MKILQVAPPFLPIREDITYGGIERILWELDKAYTELNHNSNVASTEDSKPIGKHLPTIETSIGNFEIFNRDALFLRLEHLARVLEFIKHAQPSFDIVHSHDDNFLPFHGLFNVPAVLTLHSPYNDFWQQKLHKKMASANYNLVSVSRAVKEEYDRNNFPVRFVVHNGLDIDSFEYRENKMDYLLSLGAIANRKGIHYAIQAAKELNENLIIAGTKDEEYYEKMIKPHITHDISDSKNKLNTYLNLGKNNKQKIVYVGQVNDMQKKPLYANAKCFLHPTCFEDPFPTVVIESAASGTPIVAFNRGGVPEMISEGKTGFIVNDVEEMIARLKQIKSIDPKACRDYANEKFSYKRMANDYLEIYRVLIEESKK